MTGWSPKDAAELGQRLLAQSPHRLAHVRGIASAAQKLGSGLPERSALVSAAWLHDVGYADDIQRTGFHPLDGAEALTEQEWPHEVVALVAYHTGAEYEAAERGLVDALAQFARPEQRLLDALILADLCVGPDGAALTPRDRIAEILLRYPESDPVHRAVTRSQSYLLACAERAARASGSPEEWGFAAA